MNYWLIFSEPKNHDEQRDGEQANETEHREGGDNERRDETNRDVEVGAGMFVFADEGPPSDDEELGDEDRMGLQWLNAILGFERDRVEARMRRRRARENEHMESESSNDDSSSDSSWNADAQEHAEDLAENNGADHPAEDNGADHPAEDNGADHPVEDSGADHPVEDSGADHRAENNGAEHLAESTNNGANHAEEGDETSPKETSASSEAAAAPEAEPMDLLEEELTTEEPNNHGEDVTQGEQEGGNDGEEASANEAGGNAEEETDRENEDHDWDNFPMREMIELSEFLGETNNRSRAERRGSRVRNNGTNGAGPSRRNGPRSSMSRRAVKRARLAESENHDEVFRN
ncbi:hypothetical protein ANCCAN_15090 [Ancylostoma caninum]|uniref:Uncharacterized protein n=1 Tax=Ancylostoma caninum TaxID=29170 RepID=A0A368G8G5_ANCCA|nr:hypothetical protein ANCCAN_15090 [Ancylostoma caninum]